MGGPGAPVRGEVRVRTVELLAPVEVLPALVAGDEEVVAEGDDGFAEALLPAVYFDGRRLPVGAAEGVARTDPTPEEGAKARGSRASAIVISEAEPQPVGPSTGAERADREAALAGDQPCEREARRSSDSGKRKEWS